MKNKNTKIEKYIFIDELKLYISLIVTKKLHGFGAIYNLKQKFKVLFPSYNLEREDNKDKRNLLTLDLNSEARLQEWEGIK